MPLTSDQSLVVREQIAGCLGIDVSRVVKNARFLHDLGGTGDHLKPMRLAIESALDVAIEPIVADVNAMTAVDANGHLTAESAQLIRDYFPDLYVPFNDITFPELFTVAMIEAMTAKALDEREAGNVTSLAPLSTEQAAEFHQIIARHARRSVDQLHAHTNLFRDLGMDGTRLGILLGILKGEFDVDVLDQLEKIAARFRVDADGNVTTESRQQLQPLLSGIDYESSKPKSFEDLATIGLIKSLIAKLLMRRPADLPFQPITCFKEQDWVRQLPQELGDRKLRLLLAGACRLAFRDMPNIEPEVFLALETLEKFADTGKTKSALREFQKAYWEWRDGRTQPYFGLYHALTPNDPELAVTPVTGAIQVELQMSSLEALRELKRLHRDLVSPLSTQEEFRTEWRTPAVVELAKSMYDARQFDRMSQLDELLEQAGCSNPKVLEHCRDPKAVHIRGCWVIDSILDGSWASEPKVAKPKGTKSKGSAAASSPDSKKPLLSLFPKRAQIDITKTMSEERSQVSVETYLAKYFYTTREDFIRAWEVQMPGRAEQELDNQLFQQEMQRPELTPEQQLCILGSRHLMLHLDVAVARRITLDDPAELARGLFVTNRFDMLNWGFQFQACDLVLSLFAVRDMAAIDHLAERTTVGETQYPNHETSLCSKAAEALIKRDFDALRPVIDRLKRKKVSAWMQHKIACLLGIADRQPDQITQGLHGMLDSYQMRRDEDSHSTFMVFNVEAHGLYRLAEWISPDLVAGFDVTQSFPWDAEFHAWVETHEHPLDGLDFRGVAPLLRDAILDLKVPDWWIQTPEAAKRREQELLSKANLWLLDFGENPKAVRDYVTEHCGKSTTSCPDQIMSGMMLYMIEGRKRELQRLGATLEIRK